MDNSREVCENPTSMAGIYADAPHPNLGLGRAPMVAENKISRKRIIELQKLAIEAVAWGEAHGLKRGEQCLFREMCERLWWAD